MQARKLKALLNNTRYSVSDHDDYIAVGSPLCHDLIKMYKNTKKIKSALNDKPDGELLFIWDKLHELISTGEIDEIVNGNDVIENKLPVYTVKKGELVESHTDEYGWPNTTYTGETMYENTHFDNKLQAIEYGIRDNEAWISLATDSQADLLERLAKIQDNLQTAHDYLNNLLAIKQTLSF